MNEQHAHMHSLSCTTYVCVCVCVCVYIHTHTNYLFISGLEIWYRVGAFIFVLKVSFAFPTINMGHFSIKLFFNILKIYSEKFSIILSKDLES